MQKQDEFSESLAALALGSLSRGEARAVEDHLKVCDACRTEYEKWQEVAASIAFGVGPQDPPDAVRTSLMEAIAAEPFNKPEVSIGKPHGKSLYETHTTRAVSQGTSRRTLSLIAASVVFLALLGAVFVLVQRNREARARSEAMAVSLNGTQSELAREREAVELFASPTSRIVTLKGTPAAPQASAKFAIDPETGRGMLLASNLPRVTEDRTYQLWYLVDGKPVPGGLFNTDSSGRGKLDENVIPTGRTAAGFAVTAERRGGTTAPTGQILLAGG